MEDPLSSEEQRSTDLLLSTCTALGGLEEVELPNGELKTVYAVGDEALACLKDLKRFIRADSGNPHKFVLHTLGTFNVLETDLVPIILAHANQKTDVAERYILACIELLVPMTWPLDTADEEEEDSRDPNELNLHRKYKKALLMPGIFDAVLSVIINPLRIPFRERSVRDQTVIRLVLYFLRNLTAIPDAIASYDASSETWTMASMQEELLICFCESNVMELLLTISSTSTDADSSEWNVIVLEILFNLLEHASPKDVFKEDRGRKNGSATAERLEELLRKEKEMNTMYKRKKSSRHSRFGSSYTLKDWESHKRVFHTKEAGYANIGELIDANKTPNRRGKKRKAMNELDGSRATYRSTRALTYLKQTAQSFLESCFNEFYTSLIKDIERENKKVLEKDHKHFFFTMRWFLEYLCLEQAVFKAQKAEKARHVPEQTSLFLPTASTSAAGISTEEPTEERPQFDFNLIACSMDLHTFLLCLRRLRRTLDDKLWVDVQVTSDCLRQMLICLSNMSNESVPEYREVADYIQSNIYHEQSSFDLFVDLIKRYKSQSYAYLESVVKLTHVMLKLLEQFSKKKQVMFVRKTKKSKKQNKQSSNEIQDEDDPMLESDIDEREEERDREIASREHIFKFDSFELKYASYDVVSVYCVLLEQYQAMDPQIMQCITSLFHRIMVKIQAEHLFFKLPVLDLFNRILHDAHVLPKNSATQQLFQFIRYCVRQFIQRAEIYPPLFTEVIFKSIRARPKHYPEPKLVDSEPEDNDYVPGNKGPAETEETEEDPFAVFYQKQAEEAAAKEAAEASALAAKQREEANLLDRAREQEMQEALLEQERQFAEAEAALEEIEREERMAMMRKQVQCHI
ncbi:timeless protein-domain-containing protein [Phycomyces nitens]|nr:timeless protein-domain-containing protein [Phycomyces nitens]